MTVDRLERSVNCLFGGGCEEDWRGDLHRGMAGIGRGETKRWTRLAGLKPGAYITPERQTGDKGLSGSKA